MILTKEFNYRNKIITYEELKPNSHKPVDVECDKCHKIFKTTKYQLNKNKHELCQACALQIKLGKQISGRFGRLEVLKDNGKYVLVKCDCGNVLEVNKYSMVSGHTLSCGCLQRENASKIFKELSKTQVGEGHPKWKGGIANERSRDMATNEYKTFRTKVFERDNYTCQKCKQGSNKLNVHHIESYAINKKLRHDVNNGITLCENCHKKFHKLYGKQNNKEQIKEYLWKEEKWSTKQI